MSHSDEETGSHWLDPVQSARNRSNDDTNNSQSRRRQHYSSRRPGPSCESGRASTRLFHNKSSRTRYASGQRDTLRQVARSTLATLPCLLSRIQSDGVPGDQAAKEAAVFDETALCLLDPGLCPNLPAVAIRVTREDTLNAAVRLAQRTTEAGCVDKEVPPLILNLASQRVPGGGWLNGAMAQEEAVAYRSSLALSLHQHFYPLKDNALIYSPFVLVVRADFASGHRLLYPRTPASALPVVSAVSVAALRQPKIRKVLVPVTNKKGVHGDPQTSTTTTATTRPLTTLSRAPPPVAAHQTTLDVFFSPVVQGKQDAAPKAEPTPPTAAATPDSVSVRQREQRIFARSGDRELTKLKMRMALRAAARHGHRRLVLGALGCGVFGNPPEDVARCWLEVLQEAEFGGNGNAAGEAGGHWFKDVVFAVYDGVRHSDVEDQLSDEESDDYVDNGAGNYAIFHKILHGKKV